MLRSFALFKRLPQLVWRPKKDEQILSLETQNQYADFKADFEILEKKLMPYFRDFDNEALRAQNQFRRQQVIMIVGGVIAATLGAIQAALTDESWPGLAEAVLTAWLTMVAFFVRELGAQKKYFSHRLKAETLRGEYFQFLGRLGDYADDADREANLIRRIAEIESEEN